MLRVKICGITNLQDALMAVSAGADALGFVFYPNSPRYITPAKAAAITAQLPPFVERVGLFVNESKERIEEISHRSGMSLAQLHFDVDEAFVDSLDIKALPVVRARDPQDIYRFDDRYRLIDAYVPQYGGMGKRVVLEWFEGVDTSKIVLAGGLDLSNIEEVKRYGFYGVDVSSGVEAAKGKKDQEKVREFIQKAKFEYIGQACS